MESITNRVASSVPEVTLESKVAFLRQPGSFQESTYRVEAIDTHMSWVFLTDSHAYKLKKPVSYDFLDFSTIDARHYYCQEEIRLNRRLAPEVYLGSVPLNLNSLGHLQLDSSGVAVDWLVKMQRLPTCEMLDYAIKNQTVSREEVCKVAVRLAGFYRSCAPIAIDLVQYGDRFARQVESIRKELTRYRLPVEQVNQICSAQSALLAAMADLFCERVETGRILEGHGDLRPEHVCLRPDLAIIDCLEFSRDLRIVDAADDLAFLALECERLGATDLADLLLRTYSEISGDRPSIALVHFYKSCRASLRAAISIRHLNEETFRYSAEWRRRAEEYLHLAELHLSRCR